MMMNTQPLRRTREGIPIHGPDAMAGMHKAGRLAAEILDAITPQVVPGVTTEILDKICHQHIQDAGAIAACVGYKGYPKATCISLNEVVCHGIPDGRVVKDGDILNIDVTVIVDGWHGDTSRMYVAGTPPAKAARLIDVTYDAMWAGINVVRAGATLGDIGAAIQAVAEGAGYSVVRDFCGHGIGRVFHDHPSVMHYGQKGQGVRLEAGMIFTIEPMINAGKWKTKVLCDGWTAVTSDRSLSAQFEHTLAVTEQGFEIFTRSPAGLEKPPYITSIATA